MLVYVCSRKRDVTDTDRQKNGNRRTQTNRQIKRNADNTYRQNTHTEIKTDEPEEPLRALNFRKSSEYLSVPVTERMLEPGRLTAIEVLLAKQVIYLG